MSFYPLLRNFPLDDLVLGEKVVKPVLCFPESKYSIYKIQRTSEQPGKHRDLVLVLPETVSSRGITYAWRNPGWMDVLSDFIITVPFSLENIMNKIASECGISHYYGPTMRFMMTDETLFYDSERKIIPRDHLRKTYMKFVPTIRFKDIHVYEACSYIHAEIIEAEVVLCVKL